MSASRFSLLALLAIPLLALVIGCGQRDASVLDVARAPQDPLVFTDDFDGSIYPQPFFETYYEAVSADSVYVKEGAASMKVIIPGEGSPLGPWSGGVLTSVGARDLADYNALTFYARSSVPSILNTVGFGNDNTGTSRYEAGRNNVQLDTDWTFVVVPIPDASKLIAERGLFTYAEAWETAHPEGHTIWFDEIKFASLGNIEAPVPVMQFNAVQTFVGATAPLSGTYTRFTMDGAYVRVDHSPGYFDFASSDESVAVIENGAAKLVGVGEARVTAKLGETDAFGGIDFTAYEPPATTASAPTLPAGDVISMFSDAYADVGGVTWDANWGGSQADVTEYDLGDDMALLYTGLNFVGVDLVAAAIDISGMTHLHLDVYAPSGMDFAVKIIAFDGPGGDFVAEEEVLFNNESDPVWTTGVWQSLDIPIADFGFEEAPQFVGQLAFSTYDSKLVLMDNVYWHR